MFAHCVSSIKYNKTATKQLETVAIDSVKLTINLSPSKTWHWAYELSENLYIVVQVQIIAIHMKYNKRNCFIVVYCILFYFIARAYVTKQRAVPLL